MSEDTGATRVKLVVVGDGAVGKTCLLISYAHNEFPTDYVPTVFENYTATRKRGNEEIKVHLWDTAGQEEYDRLRPLSYPGADVVLLCFSTISQASYEAIRDKWAPEVNHYIPDVPHILVGTKTDLREAQHPDPNSGKFEPVTVDMGLSMSKQIKAANYLEVSAKTRQGLEEIFNAAIDLVLESRGIDKKGESTSAAGTATSEKSGKQKKAKSKGGSQPTPTAAKRRGRPPKNPDQPPQPSKKKSAAPVKEDEIEVISSEPMVIQTTSEPEPTAAKRGRAPKNSNIVPPQPKKQTAKKPSAKAVVVDPSMSLDRFFTSRPAGKRVISPMRFFPPPFQTDLKTKKESLEKELEDGEEGEDGEKTNLLSKFKKAARQPPVKRVKKEPTVNDKDKEEESDPESESDTFEAEDSSDVYEPDGSEEEEESIESEEEKVVVVRTRRSAGTPIKETKLLPSDDEEAEEEKEEEKVEEKEDKRKTNKKKPAPLKRKAESMAKSPKKKSTRAPKPIIEESEEEDDDDEDEEEEEEEDKGKGRKSKSRAIVASKASGQRRAATKGSRSHLQQYAIPYTISKDVALLKDKLPIYTRVENIKDYLPKDSKSRPFRYKMDKQAAGERLGVMEGKLVNVKGKAEYIMFCGGNVRSIEWAPLPGQQTKIYYGKNVIQLWQFEDMPVKHHNDKLVEPKLVFSIALEAELGVLAAALSDGSVKVWAIPDPSTIKPDQNEATEDFPEIKYGKPASMALVKPIESLNFPDPLLSINSISWNKNTGVNNWLAMGGSTGLVRCKIAVTK
eukprot:gene8434-9921_t